MKKKKKMSIREKLELMKEIAKRNEQRRKEFKEKKKSQLKGDNSTQKSTEQ